MLGLLAHDFPGTAYLDGWVESGEDCLHIRAGECLVPPACSTTFSSDIAHSNSPRAAIALLLS
ncbi:MAG: hypothetical protein WA701_15290 [Solirubrobacterales bacterium]